MTTTLIKGESGVGRKGTVLVVGGGVIGISCAHFLSRAGHRVTVIDKGEIGGACSQGNCGYICPSHLLPLTEPGALKLAAKSMFQPNAPFRVKPRLSPALAEWMLQFAKRCTQVQMRWAGRHLKALLDSSMAGYRDLVLGEGVECEWTERGLLYVFGSENGLEGFAEQDRFLRDHFEVGAEQMSTSDLRSLEPALKDGLAGAFLYPGDTMLRPNLLNQNWRARLESEGVEFREKCEVEAIERGVDGALSRVQAGGEILVADRYVFALGAWSRKWQKALGCRIPIEPGKGYSVTMARPRLCPEHPMLFPEHKIGVTPFREGYRLGSMMEFAGYDESISPARIQLLRDSAEPYLREPHTSEVQAEWFGWRPMTWDSLPVIGAVPGVSNGWLCTGHNMLGLSLATGSGRLLTELLEGREPHVDASAYAAERFLRD